MRKVFLYLYPIEEYAKTFLYKNEYYDSKNVRRPFDVLNEVIQKRYRNNGYQVVYVLYRDKQMYGICPKNGDKIIYTDTSFKEASGYNEDGSQKSAEEIRYPNEELLVSQLRQVDILRIGGYHAQNCVKRVAEVAMSKGINTLVDLDMTDMFFSLYEQKEYFQIISYNPERYKEYALREANELGLGEYMLRRNFGSPVYGFYNTKIGKETEER